MPSNFETPVSRLNSSARSVVTVLAAGEQAEVGVNARGGWVVVARAEVCVATNAIAFAADDERGLRVRLEAGDAINDIDAGLAHARAHLMFAASSKRAFSSMMTVTCLPLRAASMSDCTIGESELVR